MDTNIMDGTPRTAASRLMEKMDRQADQRKALEGRVHEADAMNASLGSETGQALLSKIEDEIIATIGELTEAKDLTGNEALRLAGQLRAACRFLSSMDSTLHVGAWAAKRLMEMTVKSAGGTPHVG